MRSNCITCILLLSLAGCATPDHVASARAALDSGDATTAAAEAALAVEESPDQYAARKVLAKPSASWRAKTQIAASSQAR
ncbi:MAG: hypothetical protein R3E66_10855 [bacterium]